MMASVFENLSYSDVPQALAYLIQKVEKMENLLESRQPAPKADSTNKWMDIRELKEYLPDHPAPTTVYGWVRQNLIPYYKKGKKLSFKKSEIDEWMNSGRQQTDAELEADAIDYVNRRRIGK